MADPFNHLKDFSEIQSLTPKEFAILKCLSEGYIANKDIAVALGSSPNTIGNQLLKLFEKTNTKSKSGLLSLYVRFLNQKIKKLSSDLRQGPRVFVVDDEPDIVELIAEDLQDRNMLVYKFTESEKVLKALPALLPDIIVSDFQMPGLNGVELLKNVRNHYRFLPGIAFVTAYAKMETPELLNLGAFDVLPKPIEFQRLADSITKFMINNLHERNRYLRVPTDLPAHLTIEQKSARVQNIGYGGVFLQLDQIESVNALKLGEALQFQFELEGVDHPIIARGEVQIRGLV
jgi:FixJ family two-component response regulator